MNKNVFGVVNMVNALAMFLVVGGILVCGYYKDSPQIVMIGSLISLTGWVVDRGMTHLFQSSTSRLALSEATDISFLRQIRRIIKDGQPVTEEHIRVSESASKDADMEYQRVHGFGRPLPAAVQVKEKKS